MSRKKNINEDDFKSFEENGDISETLENIPILSEEKTLTMGEFLSTSREIKQKFNSYVIIGFKRFYDNMRIKHPNYPYKRTYTDWMQVLMEYIKT